jgi:hypothetical protein
MSATVRHAAMIAALLAVVASVAPAPWYDTDRPEYERVGREVLVPGCSSLHCTRKLVPIIIEQLPGPSLPKWKAFAVVSNVLAAVAVGQLSLRLGIGAQAAVVAMWLSACGFGALFTLFDPHSADPLMFLLGPVLTLLLVAGNRRPGTGHPPGRAPRIGLASAIAAVGVFAKEFAAAPLWMAVGVSWLAGRRSTAVRVLIAAVSVTTIWVAFQLTLSTAFDYSYGGNPSSRLLEGGYIVHWVRELGPRAAAISILTNYGTLAVLVPFGCLVAPPELRRWAIAAVPALIAFGYVQQPDRALWNFHFVAVPIAALVLLRLPSPARWLFVAAYAAANLRVGAQLPMVPPARFGLVLSMVLALAAVTTIWRARRAPRPVEQEAGAMRDRPLAPRERRLIKAIVIANAAVIAAAAIVLVDLSLHARVQDAGGLNKWGYRGAVAEPRQPSEFRIIVLGGGHTYGHGVLADQTFAATVGRFLRQPWRPEHLTNHVTVVNLALPQDRPPSFVHTLADYDYLRPDAVVIVAEDMVAAAGAGQIPLEGWRRESSLFRRTGYLPLLPDALWGVTEPPLMSPVTARSLRDEVLTAGFSPQDRSRIPACGVDCAAIVRAVDRARSRGYQVLVVSAPRHAAGDADEGHHALAATLGERATRDQRLHYVDLRDGVDMQDPALSFDGVHLTGVGHEQVADRLVRPLIGMAHGMAHP